MSKRTSQFLISAVVIALTFLLAVLIYKVLGDNGSTVSSDPITHDGPSVTSPALTDEQLEIIEENDELIERVHQFVEARHTKSSDTEPEEIIEAIRPYVTERILAVESENISVEDSQRPEGIDYDYSVKAEAIESWLEADPDNPDSMIVHTRIRYTNESGGEVFEYETSNFTTSWVREDGTWLIGETSISR